MTLFSFIAGVLAGVAARYIAGPLWRTSLNLGPGRSRYLVAAGLVASFALAAGIIYLTIGSRHSLEPSATSSGAPAAATTESVPGAGGAANAAGAAQSMQDSVADLEARLARGGGTPGNRG